MVRFANQTRCVGGFVNYALVTGNYGVQDLSFETHTIKIISGKMLYIVVAIPVDGWAIKPKPPSNTFVANDTVVSA